MDEQLKMQGTLLENYRGWLIFDTPCYPNRYKIIANGYAFDNAGWRYLPTIEEAKQKIDFMMRRTFKSTEVDP